MGENRFVARVFETLKIDVIVRLKNKAARIGELDEKEKLPGTIAVGKRVGGEMDFGVRGDALKDRKPGSGNVELPGNVCARAFGYPMIEANFVEIRIGNNNLSRCG